ncbi:MAG: NAD-dependent deacylase, partial [Bacteroidales bacterium]|nr:NAD-dependent deacylase [Bacteroidales bacterium]
ISDIMIQAAELIKYSAHTVAFTGSGISVESGIPPFRGKNGLWSKYDPDFLDIKYFHKHPEKSWPLIKEIFCDYYGKVKPNTAHFAVAMLEKTGLLHAVITQNIDNLHQEAGNKLVYELHGSCRNLVCEKCLKKYPVSEIDLNKLPPVCSVCGAVLKPDFVFFGEPLQEPANTDSLYEAKNAAVFLLIGTSGEVMPSSLIPIEAKKNKSKIIEINTTPSDYTSTITDIFLQGKAAEIMEELLFILTGIVL